MRSRAAPRDKSLLFASACYFFACASLLAVLAVCTVILANQANGDLKYLDTIHERALQAAPALEPSGAATNDKKELKPIPVEKPPVDCWDFLDRVRKGKIDVQDPNDANYIKLMSPEDIYFWASFHSQKFDGVRWGSYEQGRYYEKLQEEQWIRILKEAPPNSRILDVGGNIGIYSLLSAAMGPLVADAFEPNSVNVLRFCESLTLNGWKNEFQDSDKTNSKVNLYQYGISDKSAQLEFFPSNNPGAGSFQKTKETSGAKPVYLNVSTLDDFARERNWFETRPHISIMKVDVERYEAQVFLGAKELLHAHLIHNIFVEMSIDDPDDKESDVAALQLLADAGYKLSMTGTWAGPDTPWPHSDRVVERLVEILSPNTTRYLNLLWIL